MPWYLKVWYKLILVWQELHQVMPIMGIHVLAKTQQLCLVQILALPLHAENAAN